MATLKLGLNMFWVLLTFSPVEFSTRRKKSFIWVPLSFLSLKLVLAGDGDAYVSGEVLRGMPTSLAMCHGGLKSNFVNFRGINI